MSSRRSCPGGESPKNFFELPDAAWKVLEFVRTWHDRRVRSYMQMAQRLAERDDGKDPVRVTIPMYRTEQVWREYAEQRYEPRMIDFKMANAVSWDAGRRLSEQGYSVRFYYIDVDKPDIEYIESFGRGYETPEASLDISMLG